jgi:PST family polysaccharide transporter
MPVIPDGSSPLPLQDLVRKGALWSAGSTLFLRFANIGIMAIVARIVAPDAFGIFALAMVVQGVVVSLAELGVSSALLRSDLDPDRIAPTVATISIVTSLALGTLMAVFAEPLATALGSADAADPLRVMAISVALIGPFAVPSAQIQREFRQDVIFRAAAIAFIPSSAILIVVSLLGDGAMAFAWSRVAAQLVAGVIVTLAVKTKYRPGFRRDQVRMLVAFGLPLAMANLLSQALLNVDYVFVGHSLGTQATGLYAMAFTIAGWSTAVISSVLNGIVQPAFSKVRHDGGDLRDALFRSTRTVAVVAFAICAITLSLAEPLLTTIYGPQWSSAAPALVGLSVYGAVFVVCLLLANIIISTGRTGMLFLVQVIALAALLPAMAAGVRFGGLVGVALAHIAITAGITFPLYAMLIRRTVSRAPSVIVSALAWPTVAAVLSGLSAWSVALLLPTPVTKFLVGGVVGALVYLVAAAPIIAPLVGPMLHRMPVAAALLGHLSRPARWVAQRVGGG